MDEEGVSFRNMGEHNLDPICFYVTHGVVNWFQKSIHYQAQVPAHRTSSIGTKIYRYGLNSA